MSKKPEIRIRVNSPVVLGFAAICLLALVLDYLTDGWTGKHLMSVYRSSLLDPLTYVRFIGHVFGHANWQHFINNMLYLLLLGPLLEEKYGGKIMIRMIIITALVTGIISFVLFPHVRLCGASGVVFAMIMMSSFASYQGGEIPVTFLLVAVLYLGQEVYNGIFVNDNVSNMAHILGGMTGIGFGFTKRRGRK